MQSVNFGIDLGTTNSLIAKFENNKVKVLKNPVGQKETLASVVAFRKERVLVGDKAREFLSKDPINVFSSFKRKMGTDEKYYVVNLDENITPVELSALVLKELKTFIQEETIPEAAVITIPASFDSMQSNATLKAGYNAGFKDVFLLQEPIAASLAFFNTVDEEIKKDGFWLVYDLGGGTFDVALIKATEGELKVADHEGNNFLGGINFDSAIIDNILIPAIAKQTGIVNFEDELKVKHGKYESLYYQILYYAEEAKKELTNASTVFVDFSATLDNVDHEFNISITRQQLDELFAPIILETIKLLNAILERNQLKVSDINQLILVGGSTFAPQVREQLKTIKIPLNYSIDPTNAIAIGAAYYASNKQYEPSEIHKKVNAVEVGNDILAAVDFNPLNFKINISYNQSSRDTEELLLIACDGEYENKFYRIIRQDGGFDTGFVTLKSKKTEFLPLLKSVTNYFTLNVYDIEKNAIQALTKQLSITQGVYNIDGQPLPHDICIEVDDVENKTTKLEMVFERNSLLPQKRTLYREISKTIAKGSKESIIINILEGDRNTRPSSNLTIGCIEISGKDLQTDLVKGSDIEIQMHMTDSRVLNTAVYLVMTQQEFKNVFSLSEKQVNISRLKEQFIQLEGELGNTIREFQYNEDKIWEIHATVCMDDLLTVKEKLFKLKEKDKSDDKYVIAEKISRVSQDVDKLGGNERIAQLIESYLYEKERVKETIKGVDFYKADLEKQFQRLEQTESSFMKSKNVSAIENKINQMLELYQRVLSNTTSYLINIFSYYKSLPAAAFKDYNTVKTVIKMADTALENEKYPDFRSHVFTISSLQKENNNYLNPEFKGTGIG